MQSLKDLKANYIKAKFMKDGKPTGRAYVYRCDDEVNPGDIVTDDKGSKMVIIEESVGINWVLTYGSENIKVVKKYNEPVMAEGD